MMKETEDRNLGDGEGTRESRERERERERERVKGNYRKILAYTERRKTARKRKSFSTKKRKYNGR